MVQNSKRIDTTAEAFSAIEEALNLKTFAKETDAQAKQPALPSGQSIGATAPITMKTGPLPDQEAAPSGIMGSKTQSPSASAASASGVNQPIFTDSAKDAQLNHDQGSQKA